MFEPHDDKRQLQTRRSRGIGGALVGFVVGFVAGWLIWDRLVLTRLRAEPTLQNPSGDPAPWVSYGTLALCLAVSLTTAAVLGQWRLRKRAATR